MAAAEQESIKAIGQITGDLVHPSAMRFRDDAGDMHFACGQSHHKKHMVTDQTDHGPNLHGEEIRRRQGFPVSPKKTFPRYGSSSLWRRIQTSRPEDIRNRASPNLAAEILQRPLDTSVSPRRILFRHSDDQISERFRRAWTTVGTSRAPVIFAGDELSVPSEKGFGSDDRQDALKCIQSSFLCF